MRRLGRCGAACMSRGPPWADGDKPLASAARAAQRKVASRRCARSAMYGASSMWRVADLLWVRNFTSAPRQVPGEIRCGDGAHDGVDLPTSAMGPGNLDFARRDSGFISHLITQTKRFGWCTLGFALALRCGVFRPWGERNTSKRGHSVARPYGKGSILLLYFDVHNMLADAWGCQEGCFAQRVATRRAHG